MIAYEHWVENANFSHYGRELLNPYLNKLQILVFCYIAAGVIFSCLENSLICFKLF